MPGYNQWVTSLCRRAAFRPRFVQSADSLAQLLLTIVAENAVALLPEFAARTSTPSVVFRPVRNPRAKAEVVVAWQRGKLAEPVRSFLGGLPQPKR